MVAAGVADANKDEKAKALKVIIRAHLDGADGRPKVEHWVSKWMAFPPAAYTERAGVHMAKRNAELAEAKAEQAAATVHRNPDTVGCPMPLVA